MCVLKLFLFMACIVQVALTIAELGEKSSNQFVVIVMAMIAVVFGILLIQSWNKKE